MIALATVWIAGASAAQSTSDATTRANRGAYDLALKCFVANGNARAERQAAGDDASAASYEAYARRSFDAAVFLGQRLGYTGSRINQDFGLTETRELPSMVADPSYARQAAAMCKSAGLMP